MSLYAAALRKLGYWSLRSRFTQVMGLAYESLVQACHTLLPRRWYQRDVSPDSGIELAVELANRNSIVPYTVTVGPWLAGALRLEARATGDTRRRELLLRESGRHVRLSLWLTRLYVSERAQALREHGLLLDERGTPQAALKVLRRSCELAERQGDRWQHALCAVEVARLEAILGLSNPSRFVADPHDVLAQVETQIREALAARNPSQ